MSGQEHNEPQPISLFRLRGSAQVWSYPHAPLDHVGFSHEKNLTALRGYHIQPEIKAQSER